MTVHLAAAAKLGSPAPVVDDAIRHRGMRSQERLGKPIMLISRLNLTCLGYYVQHAKMFVWNLVLSLATSMHALLPLFLLYPPLLLANFCAKCWRCLRQLISLSLLLLYHGGCGCGCGCSDMPYSCNACLH
jgi:hypothetical protein